MRWVWEVWLTMQAPFMHSDQIHSQTNTTALETIQTSLRLSTVASFELKRQRSRYYIRPPGSAAQLNSLQPSLLVRQQVCNNSANILTPPQPLLRTSVAMETGLNEASALPSLAPTALLDSNSLLRMDTLDNRWRPHINFVNDCGVHGPWGLFRGLEALVQSGLL